MTVNKIKNRHCSALCNGEYQMKIKKFCTKHFSKVPFYDRVLWNNYLKVLGIVSSIASIVSFFITADKIDAEIWPLAAAFFLVVCLTFLCMWWSANHLRKVELRINQTNVCVKIGDIFSPENETEVNIIAVNDFFDTQADDRIVAKKSLHGRFIQKLKEKEVLNCLKQKISTDRALNAKGNWKAEVRYGKKVRRYKIGSMLTFGSYVLTAFSRYDKKNRAFLSAEEYTGFWMRFWKNIDVIYAGRTINIPLIGAGLTRFQDGKPSKQELLEIMLWTLKISGFQNTYADSKINFVIYEKDAPEIDFYHIQHNRHFR